MRAAIVFACVLWLGGVVVADPAGIPLAWPASLPCAKPRTLATCCDQTGSQVVSTPSKLERIAPSGGTLEEIRVSCDKDYAQLANLDDYDRIPHLKWACDGSRCSVVEGVYPLTSTLRARRRNFRDHLFADIRDLLASACPKGRCIDQVTRMQQSIARLAASRPAPTQTSAHRSAFGHSIRETVSVNGASAAIGCSYDGDVAAEQCFADITTPDGSLHFDTLYNTATFQDPAREIRPTGASTVYIDGALLRSR